MPIARKPYPSDVSDDQWAFVAPYLVLLGEDASQRRYPLCEVFNGLRSIVKTGAHWRMMPPRLATLTGRLPAVASRRAGRSFTLAVKPRG